MRYLLAMMSCLGLLAAPDSEAQIAVIDAANLTQNTISAVQNTITAVQSVLMVAHWVLEQTPFDEMVMAGEALEDLAAIQDLVRQAQGLSWELTGVAADFDRWFSPANEPSSSAEWRVRQSDVQHAVRQAYLYAMQAQTLVQSAVRSAQRLIAFANRITAIIGNLQGNQQLQEAEHKLAQLLVETQVTRTAFERVKSMEGADDAISKEALSRLNRVWFEDHPRW
jgi:conjugal transfer/entry exclusion protein